MSLNAETDPRYGRFSVRTDCPRCGVLLPVNGPVEHVTCGDCGAKVSVPPSLLRDLVDQHEERWPGRAGDAETLGDLTWRWTAEPAAAPSCGACGEVIRPEDPGPVRCGCGAEITLSPAPEILRRGARTARKVWAVTEAAAPTDTAPVAMSCPQCGAGLTVSQERQRLAPCDHCGVTVHLPDAVWRQLHPARTALGWVVRFEGDSRAKVREIAAANAAAEKERKREAERLGRERTAREKAERKAREEAEKAEKARQRAEEAAAAERSLRLKTIPLVVLAWAVTGGALLAMAVATAWYGLGTPAALQVWILPWARPLAPRIAVAGAALCGGLAWFVSFFAVAVRTRQPLGSLLPLGLLHAGTSSAPFVGPFFALVWAWQHLWGKEPRLADAEKAGRKVPWSVRPPLVVLLLVGPAYVYVLGAAIAGMSVPGFFAWVMD